MLTAIVAVLTNGIAAPETKTFKVEGVERTALIYAPKSKALHPPVIFGFHGHGGNMRQAARSFKLHEVWPEAVVVYMNGLPTPTPNDPQGKRNGWQIAEGLQGNRDLKFFDAVYADVVSRFKPDKNAVFSMGHSNGGRFTYLLWAERGSLFRAFGPSGSPANRFKLAPKPMFHVVGETDPIVSPENQKATIEMVKQNNGCTGEGISFGNNTTRFKGKNGNDVIAYVHGGGHGYPNDASEQMVKFFKELSQR